MKGAGRFAFLALILAALGAGAWLATRGTAPDRRDLDAFVTVGGDVVRDALHPAIDLTRMSPAQETGLGAEIDAQIRSGMAVGADPATEAYLEGVLDLVAAHVDRPGLSYRIAVVRTVEINAFAVAGGRIYITDGMLKTVRSEAELAAVLGHEVSHVDLRHCVERLQLERAARRIDPGLAALARLGYEIALLGFSEEQELAADARGALFAAQASYDPWSLNEMFLRLPPAVPRRPTRNPLEEVALAIPEALRRYVETHPPVDQRIETVRRALVARPDLWLGARRYVGRANFAARRTLADDPRESEWQVRRQPPP
ncbi:MAG TPA: M48 family metalloprotease [Candidatus Polarisedimenticolia bacterium]|nr:M48 family metalloprotease [Candidatus Polarisedimenticolia bacterium]